MTETIQSIIEWHTATFPDATLNGQAKKFIEEKKEYLAAKGISQKTEELADVFIVGCGIARFDLMFAVSVFAYVNKEYLRMYKVACVGGVPLMMAKNLFEDAIIAKMTNNRKRKWKKIGGLYKHKN